MTALRSRQAPGRSRDRALREQRVEGSFDHPVFELIAAVDRCRRRDGLPTVPTSRLWEVIRSIGYRQLSPALAADASECSHPDCRRMFLQDGHRFCEQCRGHYETPIPERRRGPGNTGCAYHRRNKPKPAR